MGWACMTASGTCSPLFIDGVSVDGNNVMNSEVDRNTNASKRIGWKFIMD